QTNPPVQAPWSASTCLPRRLVAPKPCGEGGRTRYKKIPVFGPQISPFRLVFRVELRLSKILTFWLKRRRIKLTVSTETDILIKRAAAELKTAGAREIYVFGSAARGTGDAAADLDLAVSGLPPSVFYRMGARVSDLIGRSVDLIDLDSNTPFTRYLRTENELVRVG